MAAAWLLQKPYGGFFCLHRTGSQDVWRIFFYKRSTKSTPFLAKKAMQKYEQIVKFAFGSSTWFFWSVQQAIFQTFSGLFPNCNNFGSYQLCIWQIARCFHPECLSRPKSLRLQHLAPMVLVPYITLLSQCRNGLSPYKKGAISIIFAKLKHKILKIDIDNHNI